MNVKTLVTQFIFKGSTKPLEKASKDLDLFNKENKSATSSMAALGVGAVKTSKDIDLFNREIKNSGEELSKVGKGSNSEIEKVGDSFSSTNKKGEDLSRTTGIMSTRFSLLNKYTVPVVAGITAVATGFGMASKAVSDLGKESSMLAGMGVDFGEMKGIQKMFIDMGGNAQDATKFIEDLNRAQSNLRQGIASPFITEISKEFGAVISKFDTVSEAIKKIREGAKLRYTGESRDSDIGHASQRLGFTPEFTRIIKATNDQFERSLIAGKQREEMYKGQLKDAEALHQATKLMADEFVNVKNLLLIELAPQIRSATEAFIPFIKSLAFLPKALDERTNELASTFQPVYNVVDKVSDLVGNDDDSKTQKILKMISPGYRIFDFLSDGFDKLKNQKIFKSGANQGGTTMAPYMPNTTSNRNTNIYIQGASLGDIDRLISRHQGKTSRNALGSIYA